MTTFDERLQRVEDHPDHDRALVELAYVDMARERAPQFPEIADRWLRLAEVDLGLEEPGA